jgi:hypothetical protein
MTLRDALETLAGPVFHLVQDPDYLIVNCRPIEILLHRLHFTE